MKIILLSFFTFIFLQCGEKGDLISDSTEVNQQIDAWQGSIYITFGTFHGSCVGPNCIQIYKYDSENKFYKNYNKEYPSRDLNYQANFKESTDTLFNIKDMIVPKALLDIEEHVIGCPDCADQGGIYLELELDGQVRFWLIDNNCSNVPKFLHPLMEVIRKSRCYP